MILDLISNLVSPNIGYFVSLVTNNLFWLFGFLAVAQFFSPKKFIRRFVLVVILVTSMSALQGVHNFVFYAAIPLFMVALGRIAVLAWVSNTSGGEKLMPLYFVGVTYTVLFYFNFFG